jgi:hypothetical protein
MRTPGESRAFVVPGVGSLAVRVKGDAPPPARRGPSMFESSTRAEVAACPRCFRVWSPVVDAPASCPFDGALLRTRLVVDELEIGIVRDALEGIEETVRVGLARIERIEATVVELGGRLGRLEGDCPGRGGGELLERVTALEGALVAHDARAREHDAFVRRATARFDGACG